MSAENFAVIGHPMGHTMSPFIHKCLFALTGHEYTYRVLDIAPEALPVQYAQTLRGLAGYNITIPHKQTLLPLLDALDESAARYGAVNCVANGKAAVGYNTDAYGFLKALESAGLSLGGHVLICGCGGVARTMAYECLLGGCSITFCVLESALADANRLAEELREKVSGCSIRIRINDGTPEDCDLFINASPVGMYPKIDAMPVPIEQVQRAGSVFDVVYNPRKTRLIETAEALGIPHGEGMAMLVWQAARAHEIWYGAQFTREEMDTIIAASYDEMERLFGKES